MSLTLDKIQKNCHFRSLEVCTHTHFTCKASTFPTPPQIKVYGLAVFPYKIGAKVFSLSHPSKQAAALFSQLIFHIKLSPRYFIKMACSIHPTFTSCPFCGSLSICTMGKSGRQLQIFWFSIHTAYLPAITSQSLFLHLYSQFRGAVAN